MTITVIVDDADPEITYAAPWTAIDPWALGSEYGITQSVGGTLRNISTGIDTSTANPPLTFSYKFTGTMVGVFALMTPDAVKNATVPYQWTCKLNGIPTPPVVLAAITIPTTIKICSKDGLVDGEYLLEFSFNSGTGPQVLFDYLEYIPSISATSRTYNFVGVSADEASNAYSTAWTRKTLTDGTSGVQAVEMLGQQMNCSVQYQFTGSSVTWIGWLETGATANASFTIDGQTPITTALPNLPTASSNPEPGRILFQSLSLDSKTLHTIHVEYAGIDTNLWAPLSLQSLVIGNGTVAVPSSHVKARSFAMLPGIIVGVVSSLFVISVIVLVLARKRRRKRKHSFVQPFSSYPSSFFQRLLGSTDATEINAKGLRTLLPPITTTEARILPPSKLGIQVANVLPPRHPPPIATSSSRIERLEQRRTVTHIHEEDSGLRMLQDIPDSEADMLVVLPPVYTTI